MTGKRKDKKGRVLKPGEGQRADGQYFYRYTIPGSNGKRKTIYAPTLDELRAKEAPILKDLNDGFKPWLGDITLSDLLDVYIATKAGLKDSSRAQYETHVNAIKKDPMAKRSINSFQKRACILDLIERRDRGEPTSTLLLQCTILRQAFQIAVDDEYLRKNPYEFAPTDYVKAEKTPKLALSDEQVKALLDFTESDPTLHRWRDQISFLLETGLRVSEMCGLTLADINWEGRSLCINKQVVLCGEKGKKVLPPKSQSGHRFVPLSKPAEESLRRIIADRKVPAGGCPTINGITDFVFINRNGNIQTASSLQNALKNIVSAYNSCHAVPLPKIRPHDLRHTFCSKMAERGMDVNHLRYVMGHRNVVVTLDVYTHVQEQKALQQIRDIMEQKVVPDDTGQDDVSASSS